MSAREMDRCECELGHTGPLMVLVAARCTDGCIAEVKGVHCGCCSRTHSLPYASPAVCFRDEFWHEQCGAQALLVLEPLAPGAGVES